MKIATHDGPFHADEVFATALLLAIYPEAVLTRSRDAAVLAGQDIVYDVGGVFDIDKRRFDHHMADFDESWPNGIVMSSFGLLWREHGLDYCDGDQQIADLVKERLVWPIDAIDNGQQLFELSELGVQPFTLNDIFKANYPVNGEPQDFDVGFNSSVELATNLLQRIKLKMKARVEAVKVLEQIYSASDDKRVLALDESMPFASVVDEHQEILFITFPKPDGEYIIRGAAKEPGSFEVRCPLPAQWAGLTDEDLEQKSGVAGAKFCHRNRWIAGAATKQATEQLVKIALEQQQA